MTDLIQQLFDNFQTNPFTGSFVNNTPQELAANDPTGVPTPTGWVQGELKNEPGNTPGVFIDVSGILIRDGKLTLQDEFGATVMTASGFAGTWSEYIAMGLYNATFGVGAASALALGRTSNLPFWTVARDNDGDTGATATYDSGGAATLTRAADTTFPGGFRIRCAFGALHEQTFLRSDLVPVVGGYQYPIGAMVAVNRAAGSVYVVSRVRWYDETQALISDNAWGSLAFGASAAAAWIDLGTITAPATARYAQVVFQCLEVTAHSASNYVDIGAVAFGPGSSPLATLSFAEVDTTFIADLTGATFNGDTNLLGNLIVGSPYVIYAGSNTFPGGPLAGALFYRTDHQMWFEYDGTRWVCTCPHESAFVMVNSVTLPLAATATNRYFATVPVQLGMDIYVTDVEAAVFVESGGTALGASHKWVGTVVSRNNNNTIATLNIDSGSSATYRRTGTSPNTVEDATAAEQLFTLTWTKTGTPGNLDPAVTLYYRFIAT